MADNYLERRMDDYRSGRLAPKQKPLSSPSKKPRTLTLTFPEGFSILIISPSLTPLARALCEAARAIGLPVSLVSESSREATLFSQHHGLRFYPGFTPERAITDLGNRRSLPDIIFSEIDFEGSIPLHELSPEASPSQQALFYLFAAHPDCRYLLV